ncbi:MAG: AAC(3) family N-acetyltransferase [Magnetococcales bacterium]|nr:AAC(3) family N-acetyltransferase [Magnetococcales bacterium]
MIRTTRSDMLAHLQTLGIRPGERLVVHGSLLTFGYLEGGAAMIHHVLRELLGPAGTIVVPTYCFEQDAGIPYDPATCVSTGMGAFSEYVRLLPGAVRSRTPIHNHAGEGPDASLLLQPNGTCSMGQGSDFELLEQAGFRLLLLGCRFSQGATFLHHLEALHGVPYRQWITLARYIREKDGTVQPITCRYYSLLDKDFLENFDPVDAWMAADGNMITSRAAYGQSRLMSLTALQSCVMSRLVQDPFALVRKASSPCPPCTGETA